MFTQAMTTLTESFLFGLANSVHCACMCGPLALSFEGGTGLLSYHGGRALSYGALGVVLGSTGALFGSDGLGSSSAWVAFVLAAGLIVLATVGERGAIALPGVGALLRGLLRRGRALPRFWRGGLLGLATPLLPCGLLWSACAGAAVAGSAVGGGSVMVGFALGSVPLLLLAQTQAGRLLRTLGPAKLLWLQRSAMLLAAGVLVWRGVLHLQGSSCCSG